jgi:hypothetical protein
LYPLRQSVSSITNDGPTIRGEVIRELGALGAVGAAQALRVEPTTARRMVKRIERDMGDSSWMELHGYNRR